MNHHTLSFENNLFIQKLQTKRAGYLIAFSVLAIYLIFYLVQDLFFVTGLNDFDEYFIRAEMWVNGEWNWSGGPDKLLSFLLYFPIKWFQNDFMAIYRFINISFVFLFFAITFLFVVRKNEIFPEFFIKLCIAVFFLSMPFFVFKNLTLDASALLGAMILLFFVTYNNKFLGWIGLLVYLARPEGIIIIPFYILFFLIDKKNRKSILINFTTFIVVFIGYKYIESKFILGGMSITGMSEIDSNIITTAESGYLPLIKRAIFSLVYIPVYIIFYGMSVLQNYFLYFFYLLGLVVSLLNRRMWIFYVMLGAYAFLYLGLNQFNNPFEFSQAFRVFGDKMQWINDTIAVANGREMEFNIYGHSRYRLFLYPAIAAFIIAGVSFLINLIYLQFKKPRIDLVISRPKGGKLRKKSETNNTSGSRTKKVYQFILACYPTNEKTKTIVTAVVFLFLILNFIAFRGFSEEYTYKAQMETVWMNDIYKLGFDVRKKVKPDDAIFIPNICNCNRGFLAEMMIFSGIRYTLVPVCENCQDHIVSGHPEKKAYMPSGEIETLIPSRLVFFDRYAIDYQKTFNDSALAQINGLYQNFDLNMLDSLKIKFIITIQELDRPDLVKMNEQGQVKLYENLSFK
jgi:hypothetical protein